MAILQTGARLIPGISAAIETLEREITWGTWDVNRTWIKGVQLDPAAVDTGNTGQTDLLRPGLSMGYVASTGLATTWKYEANAAELLGFLLYAEQTGATKWFGYVIVGGQIRTSDVIFNGALDTASPTYTYGNLAGSDDEATLRAGIAGRFWMDDFTALWDNNA